MDVSPQSYKRGVLYIICAGIFLSTAGLLIRNLESANAWTVLFYRSLAFFVTVSCFMALHSKASLLTQYKQLRPKDLMLSFALATGFIFYVLSMFKTSVAMTVLLLSTGPFFAAALGLIFLKERVAVVTWLSMCIALAGVGVMVSEGLDTDQLYGAIFALIAVLAFAIMIVTLRYSGPEKDMLPATAAAGIIAAVMCLPFVPTLTISLHDLVISLLLGSLQVGGGFILITLGTRSVPAAQVPLLALAETALAPLWVWWVVNEIPETGTIIGGTLILLAVIIQGVIGWVGNR